MVVILGTTMSHWACHIMMDCIVVVRWDITLSRNAKVPGMVAKLGFSPANGMGPVPNTPSVDEASNHHTYEDAATVCVESANPAPALQVV
jgi:hypothetical protein